MLPTFPAKNVWKKIVADNVKSGNERKLRNELNNSFLNRLTNVYGDLLHVHPLQLREKEVSGHESIFQI